MKLRLRRLSLVVAGATALVLSIGACTGGSAPTASSTPTGSTSASGDSALSGEITFQTWSLKNDRFTPYFEKLIADFESAHPGTKIKWMDQPGDGYEDKVLQQANSNDLPDVVNLPPEFAYKLARVGKLVNLSADAADALKAYVPGGVKAYTYPDVEGSYAFPWYLGTDLNWWNTKLLAEAGWDSNKLPTTIDEVFAMASEVAKASSGKVKVISESPKMGTLSSAGITIFDGEKFVFDNAEAIALIKKYRQAYVDGAMPAEALTGNYLGNSVLFKQGKVAWTTASAGFASELTQDAPTILPDVKTTARIGASPLFVQGISVAKESKNPALALAFAEFATNNANQVDFLKIAQGFFPGTSEANASPESFTSVIKNPLQKAATEMAAAAIPTAYPEYPIKFTYEMDTYFKQQVALAVRGDISAEDALKKAAKYANDTMVK